MFEHHRDEVVDPFGGGLGAKFKGLCGGKGLTEDHHCIHMGVYHCLDTERGKNTLMTIMYKSCRMGHLYTPKRPTDLFALFTSYVLFT